MLLSIICFANGSQSHSGWQICSFGVADLLIRSDRFAQSVPLNPQRQIYEQPTIAFAVADFPKVYCCICSKGFQWNIYATDVCKKKLVYPLMPTTTDIKAITTPITDSPPNKPEATISPVSSKLSLSSFCSIFVFLFIEA